jgi:hypothetical protein
VKRIARTIVALIGLLAADASAADTSTVTPTELESLINQVNFKAHQAFSAYLQVIAPRQYRFMAVSPGSKPPIPELTRLFQKLHVTATITRELSIVVCADDAVKALCGPKFDPAWLSDKKSMTPTLESLGAWIAETDAAIEPLRKGLCDMAVAKSGNTFACLTPVRF